MVLTNMVMDATENVEKVEIAIDTTARNGNEQQETITTINDNKDIKLKVTSTGYTLNISRDDTKLWGDALVNYFSGFDCYEVEHKSNTASTTRV